MSDEASASEQDSVAEDETEDAWYLGAFSVRTGRLVYRVRYGTGLGFNVNYAPVSLGPDGTAYVGVLGGLVRVADSR